MLNLYFSNRHEHLAATLLQGLQQGPPDLFEPVTIVVPNAAIGSWLTLRIADISGICSQVQLPLPGRFFWDLSQRLAGNGARRFFDNRELVWRLFEWLRQHQGDHRYPAIRRYLQHADELRCFELANVLAHLFDQYLIYRPDWVLAWESGDTRHWQARLWAELMSSGDLTHWVNSRAEILTLLQRPAAAAALPEPLYLFGLSALSPAYIEILQQVAQHVEVHLFALNPSRESWSDLSAPDSHTSERDSYVDTCQPLLSAFGRKGRDFIDSLHACEANSLSAYADILPDTLLTRLQRDLLELRDSSQEAIPCEPDASIHIASCHGPLRELEVLHDHLLQCFELQPELQPEDILVMLPDVDAYGPAIDAVFGSRHGAMHIPYSVADRSPTITNRSLRHFCELVDSFNSRFSLSQILSLLQFQEIQQSYGLHASDLPVLHHWLQQAGIRWGIDAEFRSTAGLPDDGQHSWRWGLRRLLLGAASGDCEIRVGECLSATGIDAGQSELLGRLVSFCEDLFDWQQRLSKPLRPGEWRRQLLQLLQHFFIDDDRLSPIREAIDSLEQELQRAGALAPISLVVMRAALQDLLRSPQSPGQYSRGGVQFCRLQCERAVPMPIIALLGLNEGALSGRDDSAGLNLMQQQPRSGDRSRRSDDRYAFLEAILASRQQLYLSYSGRDGQRGTQLPPASVLSELITILSQHYLAKQESVLPESLLTEHPPTAFSRTYYGREAPLFSYNELYQHQPDCRPLAFIDVAEFSAADADTANPEQSYSLESMRRCLQHPTRYFLHQRFGLDLYQDDAELEDEEPFILNAAQCRRLQSHWLQTVRDREGLDQAMHVSQLRGDLPHGQAGRYLCEQAASELELLLLRRQQAGFTGEADSRLLSGFAAHYRVQGRVSSLWSNGRCVLQPGDKLFHGHWISLWLNHLLLQLQDRPEAARVSVLMCSGKAWQLPQLQAQAAAHILADLVRITEAAASAAIALFPRSGWAYAEAIGAGKGHAYALKQANRQWQGDSGPYSSPESADPWHWQVYQGELVLDQQFCELSQQVYLPLIEHRQELKHV